MQILHVFNSIQQLEDCMRFMRVSRNAKIVKTMNKRVVRVRFVQGSSVTLAAVSEPDDAEFLRGQRYDMLMFDANFGQQMQYDSAVRLMRTIEAFVMR